MNRVYANYPLNVIVFIFLHAVISLIVSLITYFLLPEKYKKPNKFCILSIFSITFLLLFPGYIISIVVIPFLLRKQKKFAIKPSETLPLEELLYEDISVGKRTFGEASLPNHIKNTSLPAGGRIRASIALSQMAGAPTMKLLKESLVDPFDEIRFHAFSIMHKVEKEINIRIHKLLQDEKKTEARKEKACIYKELAGLYWEMIYLGIADEMLREFFLEKAEKYALSAMEILGNEQSVFLILGRINIALKKYEEAHTFLRKALESGISKNRVVPYLAEIYYKKGDYRQVKKLLAEYPYLKWDFRLYPVMSLWEGTDVKLRRI